MSFLPGLLAPWFLAAALAVSLPILFHLIRRMPKGETRFSSLMFVPTSPPRLTRKSRLENLIQLLLRGLALVLLAFAFARPFFAKAAQLDLTSARSRRIAILLDTSASMQRGDLWQQALAEAEEVVSEAGSAEELALFTFDDRVETRVGFHENSTSTQIKQSAAAVKSRLTELKPTWGGTNPGSALVTIADSMETLNDRQQSDAALQIVLITDLQRGSRLEALQAYEWPEQVQLSVRTVSAADATNAGIQLISSDGDTEQGDYQRVRVTNESGSGREQFSLRWLDDGPLTSDDVSVYVPPGESRVVRMPLPANNRTVDRLSLSGDGCEFDNEFYVTPFRQRELTVLYIGRDRVDDQQGLSYYLDLALVDTSRRKVTLVCQSPEDASKLGGDGSTRFVVASELPGEDQMKKIETFLVNGGTLLVVLKDATQQESLSKLLASDDLLIEEATGDYVMFGEIDFTHPLFSRFADPRYNDFTKIRFVKHRRLELSDDAGVNVLARFDNANPAMLERRIGTGRVLVLASGWHPADSRLALSTKFVPLLEGMADESGNAELETAYFEVNQPVPLNARNDSPTREVRLPDGTTRQLDADARLFSETDHPGLYHVRQGNAEFDFCVNLNSSESRTAPFAADELEQYGVRLGDQPTHAEEIERLRQLRDIELEDRQKVWRWSIIAAICVLTFETWLGSRVTRSQPGSIPQSA